MLCFLQNVRLRLLVGDDDDASEPTVDIAMALLRAIKTELSLASLQAAAAAGLGSARKSPDARGPLPESSFEFSEAMHAGGRSQSRAQVCVRAHARVCVCA